MPQYLAIENRQETLFPLEKISPSTKIDLKVPISESREQ
jgi:hypothetical protein